MTSPELQRPEVEYPESDGKPMGETELHRDLTIDLIKSAEHHFRGAPDVHVSGDLLVYYEEGNNTKFLVPDFFAVRGIEKKQRRTYKIWEEGRPPDLVVEISSKSTCIEDRGNKRVLYESLGVKEYFLFDPEGRWLRPSLEGYRRESGAFRQLSPAQTSDGALVLSSEVLGLELHGRCPTLKWFDPETGKTVPTPSEAYRIADEEKSRADEEKSRADEEKSRADAAEAELARLRDELERRERS